MGRIRFHVFKLYCSIYSNDFTLDRNWTDEDPLGRKISFNTLNIAQTLVQKRKPEFNKEWKEEIKN